MQLVEDRKIDLETDIRTYLPDDYICVDARILNSSIN